MARLLAGVLVLVSAVFLYFALTQPVVFSQLKDLNQIIRAVYPKDAFIESKQPPKPAAPAAGQAAPGTAPAPAATPAPTPAPDLSDEAYTKAVANLEVLVKTMVLKTDAAKHAYEDLTRSKGYRAWDTANVLWNAGDKVSSIAIVAFSIAYPVLKTAALLILIIFNLQPKTALRLAEFTHKYTMLDVFVAAVTLVSASSQQLLVIHTGPAIIYYVGYLISGFAGVATLILHQKHSEAAAASAA